MGREQRGGNHDLAPASRRKVRAVAAMAERRGDGRARGSRSAHWRRAGRNSASGRPRRARTAATRWPSSPSAAAPSCSERRAAAALAAAAAAQHEGREQQEHAEHRAGQGQGEGADDELAQQLADRICRRKRRPFFSSGAETAFCLGRRHSRTMNDWTEAPDAAIFRRDRSQAGLKTGYNAMKWLVQFFTWWNEQTLGTRLHTWRHGERVGEDQFGNVYYRLARWQDRPGAGVQPPLGDLQRREPRAPRFRPAGTAGSTI